MTTHDLVRLILTQARDNPLIWHQLLVGSPGAEKIPDAHLAGLVRIVNDWRLKLHPILPPPDHDNGEGSPEQIDSL